MPTLHLTEFERQNKIMNQCVNKNKKMKGFPELKKQCHERSTRPIGRIYSAWDDSFSCSATLFLAESIGGDILSTEKDKHSMAEWQPIYDKKRR
jgi:hypothetical protein